MLHDNKNKQINFRISENEYNLLQDYCNKYGTNLSTLINKLIYKFLKEKEKNENN